VTAEGSYEPRVRVERGDNNIWRIDVPVDDTFQGARPIHEMRRVPAETILEQTDADISFRGYRPPWSDLLYVPRRPAAEQPDLLRRLNGQRVRPAWVYGHDDRWQFRDPAWPWGLVGRIFNSDGFSGTGALGPC
jgi:hypothetical protein